MRDGRDSLCFNVSRKPETVAMLSLLTGIDILGMFLGSAVEQYLRDNLRSVLGRFSFLQMLS
jgi:hypothetical protein